MTVLPGLIDNKFFPRITKAIAVGSLLFLGACGTTSNLESAAPSENSSKPQLSAFEKIYIADTTSSYSDEDYSPQKMASVGREFSDMIAGRTRATGAFSEVRRVSTSDEARKEAEQENVPVALVNANITRYEDGNALARAMIGFGAGSSYFNSDIIVSDAKTGTVVGRIKADKNSWVLGGAIAATQDARSYMPGVASKVAAELQKGKTGK